MNIFHGNYVVVAGLILAYLNKPVQEKEHGEIRKRSQELDALVTFFIWGIWFLIFLKFFCHSSELFNCTNGYHQGHILLW